MQLLTNAALLASFISSVSAHGFVQSVKAGGKTYDGEDPNNPKPAGVAWQTHNTDNGFVTPQQLQSADIICHKQASNAKHHAEVDAGGQVTFQWNTWPDSHRGPVITYLANCHGPCESVKKESLKFFKIEEQGLLKPDSSGGVWAANKLVQNKFAWNTKIPNVAPGNYVARHEIIALHSAQGEGAQFYPYCVNLKIGGSGTLQPEGTPGEKLYSANDPGVKINIYQQLPSYKIPGPPLMAGGSTASSKPDSKPKPKPKPDQTKPKPKPKHKYQPQPQSHPKPHHHQKKPQQQPPQYQQHQQPQEKQKPQEQQKPQGQSKPDQQNTGIEAANYARNHPNQGKSQSKKPCQKRKRKY